MNSNALTYPNSKTLDQLIDLQALKSPNQIAISMGTNLLPIMNYSKGPTKLRIIYVK